MHMETIQIAKPKMTAKDFFLYLGILITLYVSSVALITFLFSIINIAFPKPNAYYNLDQTSGIAWPLSVFIVFFPILMILLSIALKSISKFPEKAALGVRTWFIYLTLFITALTIAIDLIVLINYFLSGEELTTGFILKVLSIVVVAGMVFWFTFKDLHGAFIEKPLLFSRFRLFTSIGVVVLIICGFFLIGSPNELRNKNEDITREGDLNMIQSEIVSFWQAKNRLPDNLEELNDPLRGYTVPTDPDGVAYEYKPVRMMTFELCAGFETDNKEGRLEQWDMYGFGGFDHSAERTCFERTIDPDRYPLYDAKPLPPVNL